MQIETTLRSDDELAQQHGSTSKTFWELFERYHEGVYSYFAVSTGGILKKLLNWQCSAFGLYCIVTRPFGRLDLVPGFLELRGM